MKDAQDKLELKGLLNSSVKQAPRKYIFYLTAFATSCGTVEDSDSYCNDDLAKSSRFSPYVGYDEGSLVGPRVILLSCKVETGEHQC